MSPRDRLVLTITATALVVAAGIVVRGLAGLGVPSTQAASRTRDRGAVAALWSGHERLAAP